MARKGKAALDNDKYFDILYKLDDISYKLNENIKKYTAKTAVFIDPDYRGICKKLLDDSISEFDKAIIELDKVLESHKYQNFASHLDDRTFEIKNVIKEVKEEGNNTNLLLDAMLNDMKLDEYKSVVPDLANHYMKLKYMQTNFDDLFDKTFGEAVYKKNKIAERDEQINAAKESAVAEYNEQLDKLRAHFASIEELVEEMNNFDDTNYITTGYATETFAKSIYVGRKTNNDYYDYIDMSSIKNAKNADNFSSIRNKVSREKSSRQELFQRVFFDLEMLTKIGGYIEIAYKENKVRDFKNLYAFIKDLIMQFANKMPAGKFRLALVDQEAGSDYNGFVGALRDSLGDNVVFKRMLSTESEIDDAISQLLNLINSRSAAYGNLEGNQTAFFDYNEQNPDNQQEAILFVFNRFPEKMDAKKLNQIKNIVEKGAQVGIFTILINSDEFEKMEYQSADSKKSYDAIKDKRIYLFNFLGEKFEYFDEKVKRYVGFAPDLKKDDFDVTEFIKSLKASRAQVSNTIYLEKILDNADYLKERVPAHKKIVCPIGKNGSKIFNLEFSTSGSNCHSIIAGATGTGKTAFLHNFIMSMCYNYSPRDVQFFLMDFKSGTEFQLYEKYYKLPHIKSIVLNNDVEDAVSLLQEIEVLMKERADCFTRAGKKDIESYNEQASDEDKLPSVFIVIDEYQIMFESERSAEKCRDILNYIASQGRSFGFHLMLASQRGSVVSYMSGILKQIQIRIAFYCEDMQDLIPEARNRVGELSGQRGRAFISTNESVPTLVTTSYCDMDVDSKNSAIKLYDRIIDKWGDCESKITILGDSKPVTYKSFSEIETNQNEIGVFAAKVGTNYINGRDTQIEFKAGGKPLVLIGDLQRAKYVETLIMQGIKNQLSYDEKPCSIAYCNTNNALANIKHIKNTSKEFALNNNITLYEGVGEKAQEMSAYLDGLIEENKKRIDGASNYDPLFALINSYECLPKEKAQSSEMFTFSSFSSDDSSGDYKKLITDGTKTNIFVIPHFSTYADFQNLRIEENSCDFIILDKKSFDDMTGGARKFGDVSKGMADLSKVSYQIADGNLSKFWVYNVEE